MNITFSSVQELKLNIKIMNTNKIYDNAPMMDMKDYNEVEGIDEGRKEDN